MSSIATEMANKLTLKSLVVFELLLSEEEKTNGRGKTAYWFMKRKGFGCPNKIVQELQLKETNSENGQGWTISAKTDDG